MDRDPKTLLIGELAALIGAPATTLRFWEDQGIVDPEKDARNQYRRYTPEDSSRFLTARKYRSFGVPLAKVPSLMVASPSERLAALEKQQVELEEEYRRLSSARAALAGYLEECRLARDLVGRFVPGTLPAAHYFFCLECGSLKIDRRSLTEEWLRRLPAVHYAVMLDPSRPGDDKSFSCLWGYGVDDEGFTALPEQSRARAQFLEERSCLLTAVRRTTARDFGEAEFRSLTDALRDRGAELAGPILGHLLELDEVDGIVEYLILLFLPIKE